MPAFRLSEIEISFRLSEIAISERAELRLADGRGAVMSARDGSSVPRAVLSARDGSSAPPHQPEPAAPNMSSPDSRSRAIRSAGEGLGGMSGGAPC